MGRFKTLAANVTVTTPGTIVKLSSTELAVSDIIITAEKSNTGDIYVGEESEVLASAERGVLLEPGKSMSIGAINKDDVTDLEDIGIDATVGTDGVSVSYVAKRG